VQRLRRRRPPGARARPQRRRRPPGRRRARPGRHPRRRCGGACARRCIDVVFNNVAQVPLAKDHQLLRTVNVDGTALLLDEAARAGVGKVVHTSSSAVFGVPAATRCCPPRCRRRSRRTATRSSPPSGRASTPCATGSTSASCGRAPSSVTAGSASSASCSTGSPTAPTSSCSATGSNRYQFVHADDLADVCLLAAQRSGPMIVNAGTDRFGTMRESLESLCAARRHRLAGALAAGRATSLAMRPPPVCTWRRSRRTTGSCTRSRCGSTSTTRATRSGWQPKFSNEEMFADSYDWFVATGRSPSRREPRTIAPPPSRARCVR
jgi:nucleoside-diphosphate-sugar epimerase